MMNNFDTTKMNDVVGKETLEKEMKEMEELIAHKIGKNMYPFSKDIHIRKEKQDIYLSVDVNVQEFHIHFEEPSWHSACYARSLEAYFFSYMDIFRNMAVQYIWM